MHRQLKAAITARMETETWMEELPLVLLGLRSAWREDDNVSPSQMMYGTSLRIPGQFVPGVESAGGDDPFSRNLIQKMRQIKPIQAPHHSTGKHGAPFLPPSLSTSAYVYVRHDAVKRPLQRPYDGPYRVIKRGQKTFRIDRGGEEYNVSIDRLKPAHGKQLEETRPQTPPEPRPTVGPPGQTPVPVLTDTEAFPPLPTTTTRSGRISKPKEILDL